MKARALYFRTSSTQNHGCRPGALPSLFFLSGRISSRKSSNSRTLTKFLAISLSLGLAVAGSTHFAQAAIQTYQDANVADVWDTGTANWDAGVVWTNNNDAVFQGTGETVDVNAAITFGKITFSVGGYTIADSDNNGTLNAITGNAGTMIDATNVSGTNTISENLTLNNTARQFIVSQAAGGTLVLSGNTGWSTNSLLVGTGNGTGGTVRIGGTGTGTGQSRTIDANAHNISVHLRGGTLQLDSASALGSGGILISHTATLQAGVNNLVFGGPLVYSPTQQGTTATFGGSNNMEFSGYFIPTGGGNQTRTISFINTGTTLFSGTTSIAENNSTARTAAFNVAGTSGGVTFSGIIQNAFAGTGTAASGITKQGAGTLILSGTANSYTGATTISNGILSVSTLANGGSNSSIGASSSAASNLVLSGGTLQYTGGNASSDRSFSGAGGSVDVTEAGTTLTLSGASYTSFTKLGAGSLTIGTTTTAGQVTGNVTVSGGTLTLSGTADNPFGAATINSGGTLVLAKVSSSSPDVHVIGGASTVINSGGTLQIAGSGGDQIYSGASITANSGSTFDLNGRNEGFSALSIAGNGVGGNGALVNTAAATSSTLSTNVTLTGDTGMGGAGDLTLANTVAGSFGLTKVGAGTLTLNAANSYSGTTVNTGTLKMGNANALGATTNPLTVNGGTLDLNNNNLTIGVLSGTGGTINSSAAGTMTLTANSASNSSFTGTIANESATTLNFTKNGAGILTLGGSNGYNGTTTISGGTLKLGNVSALGTSAVTLAVGGTLDLNGNAITNGFGTNVTRGTLTNTGAAVDISATTINNSGSFTVDGTGNITLGTVTGSTGNAIVKNGNNTVTLAGTADNSYLAGTVNAGTLVLNKTVAGGALGNQSGFTGLTINSGGTVQFAATGKSDQIFDQSRLAINGTGILDLNGKNESVAQIASTGGTLSSTTAGGVLQAVSNAGGAGTFSHTANTFTINSGATLTAAGGSTISGGTALVNGTLSGGAVSVASGATLAGNGTVAAATTISGTHSAGTLGTIDSQTFGSSLTYNDGSIFSWDLNASTDTFTNPGGYDKVTAASVSGDGVGAAAAVFRIVLAGTDTFANSFWQSSHEWTDIFSGGDLAAIFGSFEYRNSGGIIGAPTVGSFTFNGSTLSFAAVPEPTSALAGLLIGAGLLRRRRSA